MNSELQIEKIKPRRGAESEVVYLGKLLRNVFRSLLIGLELGDARPYVVLSALLCLCFWLWQIVCAGSMDTFQIYVWQLRNSALLEVLSGHEGPVVSLSFSPTSPLLASASWDSTARTWDVFK